MLGSRLRVHISSCSFSAVHHAAVAVAGTSAAASQSTTQQPGLVHIRGSLMQYCGTGVETRPDAAAVVVDSTVAVQCHVGIRYGHDGSVGSGASPLQPFTITGGVFWGNEFSDILYHLPNTPRDSR